GRGRADECGADRADGRLCGRPGALAHPRLCRRGGVLRALRRGRSARRHLCGARHEARPASARPRLGADQYAGGEMTAPSAGSMPPAYSALMLAVRITLPHFSVSPVITLPKSAGEPVSAMPPISASRALILGSARPALISRLR